MPRTPLKPIVAGWLVLLGLLALFLFLGLLKFLVFLLFMHLVTDLLVYDLGAKIPFVSRKIILYAVYAMVAGGIVFLAMFVAPRFVADLPVYSQALEKNLNSRIEELLAAWGIRLALPDLKLKAMEWGRAHMGETFNLAKRAGTDILLLIIAFILTFLIAHERIEKNGTERQSVAPENLWSFLSEFVRQKIGAFYGFFRQVMAAQVIISLINAGLTLGLLVLLGIPHKISLTVLVFVFGLLPVVGNLISNTLICLSALFWAGPWQFAVSLGFLVIVHKLEYFLNGKIIGSIVKLPMFITLLGLIIGESLFHISGMILSIPAILFVRAELSAIRMAPEKDADRAENSSNATA